MTQQTEAQTLADALEAIRDICRCAYPAAQELRRLDAVEAERDQLRAQVEQLRNELNDEIENNSAFDAERTERIKAQGEAEQLARMLDDARAQLTQWDSTLRDSVPEQWKNCASPVGAVQSYIAELEQQLEILTATQTPGALIGGAPDERGERLQGGERTP